METQAPKENLPAVAAIVLGTEAAAAAAAAVTAAATAAAVAATATLTSPPVVIPAQLARQTTAAVQVPMQNKKKSITRFGTFTFLKHPHDLPLRHVLTAQDRGKPKREKCKYIYDSHKRRSVLKKLLDEILERMTDMNISCGARGLFVHEGRSYSLHLLSTCTASLERLLKALNDEQSEYMKDIFTQGQNRVPITLGELNVENFRVLMKAAVAVNKACSNIFSHLPKMAPSRLGLDDLREFWDKAIPMLKNDAELLQAFKSSRPVRLSARVFSYLAAAFPIRAARPATCLLLVLASSLSDSSLWLSLCLLF
jgi:hypothetical protein